MSRPVSYELRELTRGDLLAVARIEREAFSMPWSRAMFLGELARPSSWKHVALAQGSVVGYLICRRYGDLWHIMDVAVHPRWRRKGVAGALLDEFLSQAISTGDACTLEVRATNVAARRLYTGRGFETQGVRRGYYEDTGEDALIMTVERGRREDDSRSPGGGKAL